MDPTSTSNSFARHRSTSPEDLGLRNPCGLCKEGGWQKENGMDIRSQEDLSQGQEKETGWVPNTSDLPNAALFLPEWSDTPKLKTQSHAKGGGIWRLSIISDACNKEASSLRRPWEVQEVQNHLKDGAAECRHSVIKIQPFRDFPVLHWLKSTLQRRGHGFNPRLGNY